ncbi:hypothetical protein BLA29_007379, partial [Euroglyphus maynei]
MKFLDWEDQGETIIFNNKNQDFRPGHSYSASVLSDMKPSDLDRIQFKWSHGFTIFHKQMYIDNIE